MLPQTLLAGTPIQLGLTVLAVLALAGVVYAYLGYPLLMRLVPRRAPSREKNATSGEASLPLISVLVPAFNEAAVIRARLENLLAQDYPQHLMEVLVVSDASDDGTDETVTQFIEENRAHGARVVLFCQPRRMGKTAGINRIGAEARGDVLVQTDANVSFSEQTFKALARAFDDPDVGVAIGRVKFVNDDDPNVAGGEGLYWRLETSTKQAEAERGLLCVANGGIYALRRSLWRVLPDNIAGDAAEPLLAAQQGFVTVHAPGALAFERAASTMGEEFQRKVRIISQQVACARWISWRKLPLRIVWAYASHKLARYVVPVLLAIALIAGLASGTGLGWIVAGCVLAPFLLAPLGLLPLPALFGRWLRVPLYFVVINAAAAVGLIRGAIGRADVTWDVPASTRAEESSSAAKLS